ncbi:MAG: tryptophan 7-halogenase [Candidatus Udaeobacter sp.]
MSVAMYDVAIIGRGPAGSTAAALLARAARRVIVFEREKFPRFHIGESLLPFGMKAFTRLALHEKFLRAGFMKKFGGEIVGACSESETKFYFKDGYRSQTDHAYQVTRGDFDKVLLDHAVECGAEVHEETSVDRVEFSEYDVELAVRAPRNVLGLAPAVNAVLGGNVGNSFPIRWRMWVFYFLVWLQRHHPIAPTLALVAKKEMLAPARTADVVS